jgi:hypothetical protein
MPSYQKRLSDVWADGYDSLAVLMGETDAGDALLAIDRYKSFFDTEIDLRFSVVTYPVDGGQSVGLFEAGRRRLEDAKSGVEGAVVTND